MQLTLSCQSLPEAGPGHLFSPPLLSRSKSAGVCKVRVLQKPPCAQEHWRCPEMHFVVMVLTCTEPQMCY